jgi:RNA polymerase sigma-70 factor (ECF subfamily)
MYGKECSLEETVRQTHRGDDWLRRLCSGDHAAFAQFIDKYKESVFLCCRRLGLREDEVEDVASETFLAAYNGLKRYAGKAELSTWIWSIAYRQAISHLRKNRRLTQLEDESEERIVSGREIGPATVVQGKETQQLIWQAVERLPRLWAMVVILYYRQERSVADIARIMQTNENTVKTYLFRARERLKSMLAVIFEETGRYDE